MRTKADIRLRLRIYVFYGLEYHSSTSYVPTAPRLTTLRNELNTQHLATSPRHFADASLFVVSKNSQFEAGRHFGRRLNGDLRAVR